MLTDPSFLYRLYRAAIQRAEVDTIFSRHFGGRLTASLPDFRTYLIAEHRDKRLNEVIYPPISMDGTERIALESHNRLLPGKCTSLNFPPEYPHSSICSGTFSGQMSPDEYLSFLLSANNLPFFVHKTFELDENSLKDPLSHYFIHSSHNTYLKGRQMKVPTSIFYFCILHFDSIDYLN